MASYVGPSESWDDYGDAVTEMSVAPVRRKGVEAQSRGAPPQPSARMAGGYSAAELAELAGNEDDWGPPTTSQPTPPQNSGSVACPNCSGACVQRTSNTAKNPGRQFYKCPNDACNYFKWADELSLGGAGTASKDGGYGSPASKRQATGYGSQQQGAYQPGYGYGGGGGPAPVPGTNNAQAAADGGVLRNRSNDTCYKCGNTGHWASQCPNQGQAGGSFGRDRNQNGGGGGGGGAGAWGGPQPNDNGGNNGSYGGGGGGGKSGSCFKCGENGHWSRDCPNAGGGGGGGAGGGYGGSYGGGSAYAGGGNAYGAGGAGGAKTGSCFKCGESGHWSRDCPNQGGGGGYGGGAAGKRKFGGGNGYGSGMGGGRPDGGGCFKCGGDHYSRDCPNK